jgi:hypothetical protein
MLGSPKVRDRAPDFGQVQWVISEYSFSNASTPADSNLKPKSSSVWVEKFVVRGCTSRPCWQRPASKIKYREQCSGYGLDDRPSDSERIGNTQLIINDLSVLQVL